jgi:hypothetical protein
MAFTFPDPITTPEFTAPNGFTYVYDQGQGLWKLTAKAMKLLQSTGSISMGEKLPFYPYDNELKMKIEKKNSSGDPDPFSYRNPESGFKWVGQNPETGRVIFYNDKWFGYSDDDGQTWQASTVMSMYEPGSGKSSNGPTVNDFNRSQTNLFTWCGGKQWIANSVSSFGYVLVTFDDFENLYGTKFYSNFVDHGFDSNPWHSLKYDPIKDEVWTTWGKGKIVQLDSDLSKWLNSQLSDSGPTSLLKYTDGPDKGVISKAQIRLRYAATNSLTNDYYFMDIGLSGHGTKLAYTDLGILVRSEDDFKTYEEINCLATYNDPYYGRSSYEYKKDRIPGNAFNKGRIRYIEETGVWIFTTCNSFQVSFDDGRSWSKLDYKTRGTKDDTLFVPYVRGPYTSSTEPKNYQYYYYYPSALGNYNSGYIKGTYYYITQESGDPKRNAPEYWHSNTSMDNDQKEIHNAWCPENVMYVTNDLRNWTRFSFGIDLGSGNSNSGAESPGSKTAFISHQPGVDRIFLLSDGHYQQTPYRVNYIDGFN